MGYTQLTALLDRLAVVVCTTMVSVEGVIALIKQGNLGLTMTETGFLIDGCGASIGLEERSRTLFYVIRISGGSYSGMVNFRLAEAREIYDEVLEYFTTPAEIEA